jgi:ankyrin repeat protein
VRAHPEYLQSHVPIFEAARRDRSDVLALLLELGFPLEAHDETGKRALHEAAANNALSAAKFLIDRGAEIDPRESTYGGAPIGWAAHGDRVEMIDLLSRYSREIWTLCFRGYVDRVREILKEDPTRARVVSKDGYTPLWWLPDDEGKAIEMVELLIAAGADPSAKDNEGRTAADAARRRGMIDVAARLEARM